MGIFKQTIGTLTVSSTTQLTLVGRTVVRLGGLFKVLDSPTLSTAVTGIGGLDTGTIAASTFYYVYAVSNGTAHGIVASTSNQLPTGFTRYKKVGAFYTNSGSLIFKAYRFQEINQTVLTTYTGSGIQTPFSWHTGFSGTNPAQASFVSGIFTIAPAATISQNSTWPSMRVNTSVTVIQATAYDYNGSVNTNASALHIVCVKQGVDAIQPDWKDY